MWVGDDILLIGSRHQAVCRASLEKDVFERYLSVLVKSRKFESKDSGNATETFAWVIFISTLCTLFVGVYWRMYILSSDVGRLYVAYPFLGAMREPDCRDRRGEKHYSHVFFCIHRFNNVSVTDKGRVGQAIAYSLNNWKFNLIQFIHIINNLKIFKHYEQKIL